MDTDEIYELYLQFKKDAEFVQMLADVVYIKQLRERGYFYDSKFLTYLKGLTYLFQPTYATIIKYPEGLWNLKALLRPGFI